MKRSAFAMSLELRGRRAVVAFGPGHASRTEVAARISGSRVRLSLPGRPWRLGLDGRVRRGRLVGTLRQGPVRGRFQLSRRPPIEGATLGLYRIGARPLGVVQGFAPRESIDYERDEVRALYQTGRGRYVVGAGLSTRNPTVGTASFSSNRAVFRGEQAIRVPLRQEEVWVRSGRAYLGCTLTIPPGSGRRPALAFAHGAGQAPRRFNSILATYLNHLGLVTLSCDKRGAADSHRRGHGSRGPGDRAEWSGPVAGDQGDDDPGDLAVRRQGPDRAVAALRRAARSPRARARAGLHVSRLPRRDAWAAVHGERSDRRTGAVEPLRRGLLRHGPRLAGGQGVHRLARGGRKGSSATHAASRARSASGRGASAP